MYHVKKFNVNLRYYIPLGSIKYFFPFVRVVVEFMCLLSDYSQMFIDVILHSSISVSLNLDF